MFVSNVGNFFFVVKKRKIAELRFTKLLLSAKKLFTLIAILKNFFWYCSFDQFLWAIGAFVEVKILFLMGRTKNCILFFSFFLFSKKVK
jgi:hypothetical protein